jgi:hypothetical protein
LAQAAYGVILILAIYVTRSGATRFMRLIVGRDARDLPSPHIFISDRTPVRRMKMPQAEVTGQSWRRKCEIAGTG